jgi:hypothetical protein
MRHNNQRIRRRLQREDHQKRTATATAHQKFPAQYVYIYTSKMSIPYFDYFLIDFIFFCFLLFRSSGLFCVFFALMGVVIKDGAVVIRQGYFHGYTPFVWLIAAMQVYFVIHYFDFCR